MIALRYFLLISVIPTLLYGQKINDNKSISQAITQASLLKKNILVVVNVDSSFNKNQRNLFEDQNVISEINKQYVVYQTNFQDPLLRQTFKYYNLCNCPTFLFMHPNKNVFYKSVEFDASKDKFLNILNNANLVSKEKDATDLHRKYLLDTTNVTVLKELIDIRKKGGLTNNAYFIEKYVRFLKPEDLKDYKTVLYILEAGPRLGGPAYIKAYTYPNIVDSIYKKEPREKLLVLSKSLLDNTWDIGIKTKCLTDAINVATYYKKQWLNNNYNGEKIYQEKLLQYYNDIKDTLNYLPAAFKHYNEYYMKISADSIKKLKQAEKNEKLVIPGWKATSYQNNLNIGAWHFFTYGAKDPEYLSTALKWSKRSIEIEPKAIYHFTLAHLYYKTGNYSKAQNAIKTGIELAEKEDIPHKNFYAVLSAIKNRTL